MKFTGKDGKLRIYCHTHGYLEIHFCNMDFSAAIGRPKRDEILVLDRGLTDTYSHYITGNDAKLFDPVPVSFSCMIDSVTHLNSTNGAKEIVTEALQCRDARNDETDGTWLAWGDSTKGTSLVDGKATPQFLAPTTFLRSGTVGAVLGNQVDDADNTWELDEAADYIIVMTSGVSKGKSFKIVTSEVAELFFEDTMDTQVSPGDTFDYYDNLRTVDVQYKLTGETNSITWKLAEVYFPPDEITIAEAEDGITMSVTGGIYGAITRHSDWS